MNLGTPITPATPDHGIRVHSRGDRYVVIDDLLPRADFEAAADDIERVRLKPVLSTIDPVYDGFAYRGGEEKQPLGDTAPDAPRWQHAVKERVADHLDLLDAAGKGNHVSLTLSAWGYPAGSRLSWHNDAGADRIGAYVYFVHRTWNADWGGGLALFDEASRADAPDGTALLHCAKHPALILPRPNRLVVFRAHTMHAVQRVDATAGDRMRRTWTGFITTKDAP
ncbi:2OG-Fe(II) oxygenase [Streptomyces sp. NPDC060333]|uniref:2OG-Fe(II) oxygenase n=1 Tax=Streptomyces sp. NPDC060333 TaxID=3347098 RepID=UPI003655AF2E